MHHTLARVRQVLDVERPPPPPPTPPISPPLSPDTEWLWALPDDLCAVTDLTEYTTQADALAACVAVGCLGLANESQLQGAYYPGLTWEQNRYGDRCERGWVADYDNMITMWVDGDNPESASAECGGNGHSGAYKRIQSPFFTEGVAYCTGCPNLNLTCPSPAMPPPTSPPPATPAPCGADSPIDPTGIYKDTSATHGDYVDTTVAVSCALSTGPTSPYGQSHKQIYCTKDETTGVDLEFPRCVPVGDPDGPNSALTRADGAAACNTEALDYYGCMAGCRTGSYCCSSTGGSCIPLGEVCPCPSCAYNRPKPEGCTGGDEDYRFLITSAGVSTQCCMPAHVPQTPPPASPPTTPPPTPPPFPPPPSPPPLSPPAPMQGCLTADACAVRATELGFTLGFTGLHNGAFFDWDFTGENYPEEGCYTYNVNHSYHLHAFFGMGGTEDAMSLDTTEPRERIECRLPPPSAPPSTPPPVPPPMPPAPPKTPPIQPDLPREPPPPTLPPPGTPSLEPPDGPPPPPIDPEPPSAPTPPSPPSPPMPPPPNDPNSYVPILGLILSCVASSVACCAIWAIARPIAAPGEERKRPFVPKEKRYYSDWVTKYEIQKERERPFDKPSTKMRSNAGVKFTLEKQSLLR